MATTKKLTERSVLIVGDYETGYHVYGPFRSENAAWKNGRTNFNGLKFIVRPFNKPKK